MSTEFARQVGYGVIMLGVWLAALPGSVSYAEPSPAGAEEYGRAYELFMEGDLAGARQAFEGVRDLKGADPSIAADAGVRVGWLFEVAQRLDDAQAAFARVEGNGSAPALYQAEAAIGIGQCRFDAGDMGGASNAFERALALMEKGKVAAGDQYYLKWLRDYAVSHRDLAGLAETDSYYNNRMRGRAAKWPSPLEQAARETILRRWMSEQGLGPERCYLKGQWVLGTPTASAPYPAAGFPYVWEFDDGTLCGLSLTQGLVQVRSEAGSLKFTTGAKAGFGWGRSSRSDLQSPLRFGYATNLHEVMPRLSQLCVRLRQSRTESAWRVRVGGLPRRRTSGYEGWDSSPMTVRGTNWQEVVFRVEAGAPPYFGVQFFCDTPANEIEIDWVRPEIRPGPAYARKDLVLPAQVRWARISISAPGRFRVFVNAREALRSPLAMDSRQMWNYELDASWFQAGTNVVALAMEAGSMFLVDGALLCADGTHWRFDSDGTWRSGAPAPGAAWAARDYAEAQAWPTVRILPVEPMPMGGQMRFWFNPSYKGGIMVEPADGRPQPVYGCRETVALKVAVPAPVGQTPEVRWTLYDAMGDGARPADRKVQSGQLSVRPAEGVAGGELSFSAGSLASNVAYALELEWRTNGATADRRRYELAICGPVPLPEVVQPTNYTDGMELKLVWEMNAADDPPPDAFISCDGNALPRPSAVIKTPLGRFRQPYPARQLGSLGGSPCNYISYRYRIEHPGRPHVAIAEYPDDTVRVQEMRLTEDGCVRRPGMYSGNELGNDTVVLGFDNPLTHELRQHHCLFFPGRRMGTVTFLSLAMPDWDAETAARVGRIRIYEILNDVPARRMADAPGPRKWVGQLTERGPSQILNSCLANPLGAFFPLSESPVFYRNWMSAAINMVKRMKFAGENAHFCGMYMYDSVLYPSAFSDKTAMGGGGISGSLRDYGVLLARMFEENGLGLFSALQIIGSARIPVAADDEAVAAGAPTFAQVGRDGRQQGGFGGVTPNWIHPAVRGFYEQVIREVTDLYGREPGWKGIVLHLYDTVGPSWCASQREPGGASYDDYTIAQFESETGLRIPAAGGQDPQRFAKRAAWLMEKAKPQWTEWRCARMHDIYKWTADCLKSVRPDLDLIIYPYASYLTPPYDEPPEQALPSLFDYGRRGGLDLERIKKAPDMILAANVFVSLEVGGVDTISGDFESWLRGKHDQVGRGRALAHRESSLAPLANDGKNGLAVRYNWYEAQPRGPDYWLWTFTSPESWPYPQDDYFADYWINSFVRTNPRLILHPLMDAVLWNGRETSMSRFAQAFRSLPATPYARLAGNGRDQNVWIATATYEGQAYGYVANTYWWETDVTLVLGADVQGQELTTGEALGGGKWRGRLAPYSMRTFRFERPAPEAITRCETVVGAAGKRGIEGQIGKWRAALEQHGKALGKIGRASDFEAVAREAEAALRSGDAGAAYERLTAYPTRRLWALVEPRAYSQFIADGWRISRLLPRGDRRDVRALDPVRANDESWEWRPLNVAGNRIMPRSAYGEQDGFVYLANRIRVPAAGEWTLCVGHDGGCRVFIDGQEALCQPQRRNPIQEDRTKATLTLTEGDHEVVVAFDLDHGLGWGLTMRFQAPEGKPRLALDFPSPTPRDSAKATGRR